ncbi:branched-chain amino acid transport system substrate-binding protein [Agromyces flavus]|uniref:Amino acid/amide ABC transporter substrate-binding protein, HAAT family n=1 Tax=Agromyces flavus TaxID=589382 RepID=A0A1H1LST1_9MICO|nr:ABC transporter substrate-binding protein [Agromyces flavus]MCP2368619.1 branched-chain amino acid transport system substrate-binding protein [Agromyces flavus]GGI48141.1 branched-chain amino acid ABC transporter substrate-binding protein [Agromyces flavus]SDR77487.1 amino acid/amide ABC transporter substrate-binding protein, HAAT family [Agromyces flavus]
MSVFAKATASRSARAAWTGIAIAGVSALLLTACSTGGNPEPAESEEAADTGDALEIEAGERDLTLKVGTILPQSGTLAFLGPPEEAGVALAAQEINEADAGINVEVVYRDSGDTTTDIATVSVTDLLSQDVSAIVGAASSGVSLTVIDQITSAGVVHFSPANTSPDFTDYEDNGLYFRTAPSDLLQGEVLGNLIAEDGASTLGLLVLNDPYGTGLAGALKETFESAGGEVVAEELFNTGDSNFDSQLSAINAANPDAVAVITFDESKVVVPALVGSGYPGSQLYFVDGNLKDYSADFAPGLIADAKGTLPGPKLEDDFRERLLEVDPALTDFSYGPESYDALMLIAMAAYAANSVEGTDIGEYLQQVSGGSGDGEKVTSFADAAALLAEGQQVDYDGASGPITLNEKGDPTEATIGIYQYGDDNKYTRIN